MNVDANFTTYTKFTQSYSEATPLFQFAISVVCYVCYILVLLTDMLRNMFSLVFVFYFIYLFILAVLGLRCCARAFSGCGEWGLLFVAVCGLLIAVASLLQNTGSRHAGFSSCSTQAW